jgi:rubredoxin
LEVFACQPCGGTLVPALYRLRHREFHTDEAGMHRWYTTLTVRFERGDHIEMGVLPAKTIVSVQMATPGAPDTTSPAAALPDDIRDLGEMLDSFSLRIECPACGFVEEASPAHPSSFRAPAPAKAARITVVCPKCGASFEVVMS